MSAGFLVDKRPGLGLYLERIPFNGSYEFIAMDEKHATVFTREQAELMAREFGGHVVPDLYHRRNVDE